MTELATFNLSNTDTILRKTLKKGFVLGLISLLTAVVLAIGSVHLVSWHSRTTAENLAKEKLVQISQALQSEINYLTNLAENLAHKIEQQPEWVYSPLLSPLLENYQPKNYLVATAFTEGLDLVYAHPVKGNESIIGMNLNSRPLHLKAANEVFKTGVTSISGPAVLQQTNALGLIIHSPFIGENNQPGMVVLWVDFAKLLAAAGYIFNPNANNLLIEAKYLDKENRLLLGKAKDFNNIKAIQSINLPNAIWKLGLTTEYDFNLLARKLNFTRLISLALIFPLVIYIFKSNKVFNTFSSKGEGKSFYTYITLVISIPSIILLLIFASIAYITSEKITEDIMQRQLDEGTNNISTSIEGLLAQPKIAINNLATFTNTLTNKVHKEDIYKLLLSQLRIQNNLSLISFTKNEGEYIAVNRPTEGKDLSLKIFLAKNSTDKNVYMHWVTDANNPSREFILEKKPQIDEVNKGLAASFPISANNELIGTLTAEISKNEINNYLHKLASPSSDRIFLMERNYNIYASSSLNKEELSLINQAKQIIKTSKTLNGNSFAKINGKKILLDWQLIELIDNPSFILAKVIESKDIEKAKQTMLGTMYYLVLAFIVMGSLVILAANFYITRPLQHLTKWAGSLGKGNWHAKLAQTSNIKEISSLNFCLSEMAEELESHTKNLEQRVKERTQELALANQKLEELSLTDPLTGIANRRRFNYVISKEWKRSFLQEKPLGLIFIDIDWFKKYNDYYGHLKGDEVLIKVATTLEEVAGSLGLVARYGGEEFALVIPETTKEDLTKLAEQLLTAILNLNIAHLGSPFNRLTLSLGISCFIAPNEIDFQLLIAEADKALYQAKDAGRNRFVLAKM